MHVTKECFAYLLGLRWLCSFTALATLLYGDTHIALGCLNSVNWQVRWIIWKGSPNELRSSSNTSVALFSLRYLYIGIGSYWFWCLIASDRTFQGTGERENERKGTVAVGAPYIPKSQPISINSLLLNFANYFKAFPRACARCILQEAKFEYCNLFAPQ